MEWDLCLIWTFSSNPLGTLQRRLWFQFSSFLYFLRAACTRNTSITSLLASSFIWMGFICDLWTHRHRHANYVGSLNLEWQTLLLQLFGNFCILNNYSVCMCFISHHTHEVRELVKKIFFTFVRSMISSRLLKHCCKVVFAFSQISLKSWKRSTSYRQRWQIKFGRGSLADTCDIFWRKCTVKCHFGCLGLSHHMYDICNNVSTHTASSGWMRWMEPYGLGMRSVM